MHVWTVIECTAVGFTPLVSERDQRYRVGGPSTMWRGCRDFNIVPNANLADGAGGRSEDLLPRLAA